MAVRARHAIAIAVYFAGATHLVPARAECRDRRSEVMIAYLVRRLLYAIPILLGVNVITFALFLMVNTPDDMARMQLGIKRVTPEAIAAWKHERGYDKPLLYNAGGAGVGKFTQTIFYEKSLRMFVFDFGR